MEYKDMYLIPNYSEIESRKNVDLSVNLFTGWNKIALPIISANMIAVTGSEMAIAMHKLGGVGIIHRFYSTPLEFANDVKIMYDANIPIDISIGVNDIDYLQQLDKCSIKSINNEYPFMKDIYSKLRSITIDIAHGHSKKMIDQIKNVQTWIRNRGIAKTVSIIAGNVCTKEGVKQLINAGAHIIKIGIGPGRNCTTRLMTGFGSPQPEAILECAGYAPIIADGGIHYVADIAKSLALGANAVMIGGLLAGCKETPMPKLHRNNYPDQVFFKRYMGSASYEVKLLNGDVSNQEGISTEVPYTGSVKYSMRQIQDGLRSAFSYAGVSNMKDFQNGVLWKMKK